MAVLKVAKKIAHRSQRPDERHRKILCLSHTIGNYIHSLAVTARGNPGLIAFHFRWFFATQPFIPAHT